jgi:hypothetical protein
MFSYYKRFAGPFSFGLLMATASWADELPTPLVIGTTPATESVMLVDAVVPPAPAYEAAEAAAFGQMYAPPAPAAAKPSAPKPPPQPWKPMFFDNDFSYKKLPNAPHFIGEELKDLPARCLWDCEALDPLTISTGGEFRFRYVDEINRFRPAGPGHTSYDQYRWRHYVDAKYGKSFRAYVEMIDGSTWNGSLPLVGIDENRWDLQNYLVDVKVAEVADKPVWFRVGRQELFYGNQRLVSPLDWSNIRRNFEGLKLFTKNEAWDFDMWLVNPVNTATPLDQPLSRYDNEFDSRNQDVIFGGAYWTYKAVKDNTFDLFFLWNEVNAPLANFPDGDRYTLGTRWLGNRPVACGDRIWHAEVEGGYQFGNDRSALYSLSSPRGSVQAGYFTGGVGHTWKSTPWEPNLWVFYDWASGDDDPADGQNNTFFQHYGLVHAYFGLIDNISRQNMSDVNYRFTVKPHQKLQVQAAQHWFTLSNNNDVLYNVTGAAVGTPNHGKDIGQELDLVMTYTHNPNWSVEMGYFWFWYGEYVAQTTPRADAEQLYLLTTFRY